MDDQAISSVPITAIVTAYQRIEQTLLTLKKIRACEPCPDEILVHVDANQRQCETAIRQTFPDIKVLLSKDCIGPGGGRNKLVVAAKNEFIASFDDDSYPVDADYFARVLALFKKFPSAMVLGARLFHQGEALAGATQRADWVADFVGAGCIYRRSAFLATDGYVPLPVAYGMEEVDLALRLHAQGGKILKTCWLRVFHDTDLAHHASPTVTASSIANLALLAYLRYPPSFWLVGFGQCCSRIIWLLRHERSRGIVSGLLMIPAHLWAYRHYQQRIESRMIRSYLELRRTPSPA